jgi:hypothetical protein
MPNHSITRADMSREVRQELYDGTARILVTAPDGSVLSDELVPSDEQAPSTEPTAEERIAALEADLAAALALLQGEG